MLLLPLLAVQGVEGATQVFYSVGTSRATLTDLKVGSPTVTIAGGVATFSIPQATNVGVGDEISYGAGPTLVYISGRLSSTQYTVTDRLGAPAADVTAQTVNRIYRAFASLSAAEANSTDGTHLGTANLVGGDIQLNWPCYNDGALNDWVLVDGYTTGPTQYIRIHTPTSASEVGISQRHRGFFGTGFQINVTNNNAIHSTAAYLRVEGLVIEATVTNNFSSPGGIMSGPAGVSDVRISHNIVKGIITPGVTGVPVGIGAGDGGDVLGVHRVWNNVVYNFTNDAAQASQGLSLAGGTTYVFNNTVFNSKVGIVELSPVVGGELRNNVSINDALNANNVDFLFPADLVWSHNVSSDSSSETPALRNKTAYATYFANTVAGTEDLHLRATSLVLWGSNGMDLSAHANLPVTDDFESSARVRPDIGADETGGTMRVKSGTYVGNGTSQAIVGVGFRPDFVIVSADSTNAGVNGSSGHTDVLRTSTMAGNVSKAAYIYGYHPLVDRITSLDADGFSVGHPPDHLAPNDDPGDPYHCANHAGIRYYWVAFQAAPGEMSVGTYTGNGAATQNVTTVGFQPDYTLVLSDDGEDPIQRFRLMPFDFSTDFDGGSQCFALCTRSPESGIRTELANGFEVGQYVNVNAVTYHYVAWKETAGRIKVGTYLGDGNDDVPISGLGFRPEMVQVANGATPVPSTSTTYKTAATGANSDYSLVYIAYTNGYQGPDDIQALQADGFQIGQGGNVNNPGNPHYWIAFGPGSALPPPTYYRSIGGAVDLVNQGTITLTAGSTTVTKTGGTGWLSANRGRGDRLSVNGTTDYVVAAVSSDDQLVLTSPAVASYTGSTYTIARQFLTLAAWEDCVDGPPGTACPYFPVTNASLVADNRNELGIAYDDNPVGADFPLSANVVINGSVTDATHTIRLTADGGNRHNGAVDGGVVLDGQGLGVELLVRDSYVTVEWLEFIRFRGAGQKASVGIVGAPGDVPTNVLIQNVLIHDFDDAGTEVSGIRLSGTAGKSVTVRNCMIWDGDKYGIEGGAVGDTLLIENCSIDNMMGDGTGVDAINSAVTVNNTIVTTTSNLNYDVGLLGSLSGSNNTSSDGSAPGANPQPGVTALSLFVSPNMDLHLKAGAIALDTGLDLSASFSNDIDGQSRLTLAWDRGADERGAPTAVELVSFEAAGANAAVDLTWETASELRNLGFHLYRSTEVGGPYTRLTSRPIPGLGSSPAGARYLYRDSGLVNGTTYFYKLEDIETTGTTALHGPVSATPSLSAGSPPEPGSIITYGNPDANRFRVVERSSRGLVVELVTEGFTAEPQEDGSVRLEIPGFEPLKGSPSLPVLRPWVEAAAGREIAISSIRESAVESFEGLRPSGAEEGEIAASRSGTVRARRGRSRKFVDSEGWVPETSARLLQVGFQGETKKAQLELAPLRWNGAAGELQLSRRLTVHLAFSSGRGRTREEKTSRRERGVLARLVTTQGGLHEVSYEELFQGRRGGSSLEVKLTRLGEPVSFHIEPAGRRFGPGSRLYFVSAGPQANPYGHEAVYELERGDGLTMELSSASPSGEPVSWYVETDDYEENRFYQAGLLEAPDVWLWDLLMAPVTKAFSFETRALASRPASLTVRLQGVSDFASELDHHVRLYVNGALLDEVSWDGKASRSVELDVPEGGLREGENQLEIENVGNTGAAYSMVMLDGFQVSYPRAVSSEEGLLEGLFPLPGRVSVAVGPSHLLDVSEETPRWLSGGESAADGSFRFRAEAGRRYLAVARESVRRPLVRRVAGARLAKETLQADYLVIGPSAFEPAAARLLQHRSRQGLRVKFASVEDIYSEFGFGEARPEAIQEFLSYAYHHWREPKLRYVLLLGDATYDFKDYLQTGVSNRIPPLLVKTSYLWTVSDPALAAVNGEDVLPDVAIGRLPAAAAEELSVMVEKLLAYERGEADPKGLVVLVNDNSDRAGDFAANADELARGPLAGRAVSRLDVGKLGAATRGEILAAFDEGASLVSYIGHGGIHLWADENVFNTGDVESLSPQPQQPLLLTMNCLNGYFHVPYFDSLAESLVKAEGKGAIAAFSPSGLSWNEPAHRFHQALLDELLHKGHERLGDAVLAAQERYASTGAFPELLSIYHLLGDPAMTMR
jgi:hypothetical protein